MTVFPLATVPLTSSYPPSPQASAFFETVTRPDAEAQYLIEIVAYKGGEARSGGLATLTEIPMATIPKGGGVDIGQVTFAYADSDWVGAPTDPVKPNTYYEGRVSVPLVMERFMPLLPEEERRVQRQFGQIEIANGDGALDPILQSYAVDGRRVRVLFGPKGGAYRDFAVIADVLGTGWEGDSLRVRLGLRDQSYSLDLPLQTDLYAGSGGAEGTAELEGKPKPLLFGRCRNVTPVLLDPTNLIYQVHDGVIEAIDGVFDRGAAITDSTDDAASYAALVSLSVSSGEFATCKAQGLFKLGGLPDGLITADVRGDATPDYQNTLDQITLRLLRDRALLSAKWIDTASFAGAAAIAGELGIYISQNESPTTAQIISRLMAAVGGWWGAGRDGRIRAGRLTAPENRTPQHYLGVDEIMTLEPEATPVPRWRQRVAYQPNWTEQRGEDLATSVTAARRQFLTEKQRVVFSADAVVRVRHLQALDPEPLPTLYESSTDAQTLADYLAELHSPDRRIFRITVKRRGYLMFLGSILRLTWPRHGLGSGKNVVAIGIREDADRDETVIRCWG